MSTTKDVAASPSGANWEMSPRPPMAAATEVTPSSSGTQAATRAPNAASRMMSVTGREMSSALRRSSSRICVIVASNVPGPATCTVVPGCAARTSFTTAVRPLT